VARQSLDDFLTHARSLVDAALDHHLPVPPACRSRCAIASAAASVSIGRSRLPPAKTL